MYNFTFFFRATIFGLLLAGFGALPGAAQIQYAKTVVESQFTDAANDNLAVDSNPTTAGKLRPTLLGGVLGISSSYLRVGFANTVPPGQQAGIIVQPDNFVAASALSGATITTYKKINATQSQPQQSFALGTLLGVGVGMNKDAPTTITFQPAPGKEFDHLEMRVTGVNIGSDINFFEAFTVVAPLPVKLLAFQGKAMATGVALNWATASEQGTDYFEVQRAEHLADSFRPLGQLKSAGTSAQTHTYQFVDAQATGVHYYRLRQVDADGTEAFSPVVTVEAGLLAHLTAYPTLATTLLNVAAPAGTQLRIFNQQGQHVQTAAVATSQPQPLDVSSLPGGVYFLRDAATGQSIRFIKITGR